MSLSSNSEYNAIGGGYGGGFGGFGGGYGGGFPLFGLLGLKGIDGFGGHDGHRGGYGYGGDNCAREAALLAAISNVKDDNRGNTLGLAAAIANAKDTTVGEGRALGNEICDVKSNIQQAAYASAIQASNLASEIKAQGVAFQIANDNTLNQLSRQIAADGDATRALINNNTIQDLRDQLDGHRRRGDSRELEINIQNTAIATQLQQQQQQQALDTVRHRCDSDHRINDLINAFNQTNRNTQDIINLGTMTASGTQATQSTNIK